jgi:catechol 2,3-dioxygenase-like lactoylglutathione lyase family enzyme
MAEGIPVTGVSELVLEVADLAAAERFYAGVLGLPVVERWSEREAVWVMAGERTRIGLWKPQVGIAGGRGGVHVHFAMHVADADYDAAVRRLREHGQEVEEFGFGPWHGRAAYVTDPDGNVVELWTWDVAGHLAAE